MHRSTFILIVALVTCLSLKGQDTKHNFRIRTITAGINLASPDDTATLSTAIKFLKLARAQFQQEGYQVQTTRVSTQNFYMFSGSIDKARSLTCLRALDKIASRDNIVLLLVKYLPLMSTILRLPGGASSW